MRHCTLSPKCVRRLPCPYRNRKQPNSGLFYQWKVPRWFQQREEWIAVRNKAVVLCGPAELEKYVTGYWGWGGEDENYT